MSSVSKPRVRHNRHKQGLNLTLEKLSADFREYKKAIEVHPDLVNLDRPELFIKILHQEIKK